jgi:hypothetical protein
MILIRIFHFILFSCFLVLSTNQLVYGQVPSQRVSYPHTLFWNKTEITEIFENSNFGVGVDFIHRRSNVMNQGHMFSRHLRTSVRPWVHYQISPYARFSISPLGYFASNGYIGKEEDFDRPAFHELRTTFQFFHHTTQMGGRFMHTWRYRYELRNQYQPASEDYRFYNRFRFRYRLRVILNTPDFYTPGMVYLAFNNEVGLNFGKNVNTNIFNQNRVYVGVGARMLNAMRVELRYVNLYASRGNNPYEFDNGQGLMVAVSVDQFSYIGRRYTKPIKFTD